MNRLPIVLVLLAANPLLAEDAPPLPVAEFDRKAEALRRKAIESIEPRVQVPTEKNRKSDGIYRWRNGIVTTVFFAGKGKGGEMSSAWDSQWAKHFGGHDNPTPSARLTGPADYRPKDFIPQLNPFYCALPYNDIQKGVTKPEARTLIPWFSRTFIREGESVCQNRWVSIRNPANTRVAYAQWSDAGPFRTDSVDYVFGAKLPEPNAKGGAGLSISPSVRDFLGSGESGATDWRFVEQRDVPPGPWRKYGANNPFLGQAETKLSQASPEPSAPEVKSPASTATPP